MKSNEVEEKRRQGGSLFYLLVLEKVQSVIFKRILVFRILASRGIASGSLRAI
jgi:hypothetical protein